VEELYQGLRPTSFVGLYDTLRMLAERALPRGRELKEHLRRHTESQLDECFSRLLVPEIPRMVRRALQLEPMLIEEGPRADENPYVREATRCFLFGLFNASVALSRSALEQAFHKKLPLLLQDRSKEDSLQMLIKTARTSVLKRATEVCDLADQVRKKANVIVHGSTCREAEALQVLRDTRKIISYLCGKRSVASSRRTGPHSRP
jgi:hypothetical protein